MPLHFFNIYKYDPLTPARRNAHYYRSGLNLQGKFKPLSLCVKWRAGRGDSGRTILWSKSSRLVRQKQCKINYNLHLLRLGMVAGFRFVPFKNKLLTLVYFCNGAATYFLTTGAHRLFMFLHFFRHKKFRRFRIKNTYLMLFQIKKLAYVSCLELLPGRGAQYARSSGTKARILRFDLSTHSVLAQLPSGTKKVFSYYSFVMLGRLSLTTNSKYTNTRAGYWRSFGVKPTVRGVAMNPVDHPHGGRTKSIKYPRTPWGKTTKFK